VEQEGKSKDTKRAQQETERLRLFLNFSTPLCATASTVHNEKELCFWLQKRNAATPSQCEQQRHQQHASSSSSSQTKFEQQQQNYHSALPQASRFARQLL
jgi:hypothetical protein